MKVLVCLVLVAAAFDTANAHGRLWKPTSRSTVWRVPEFANQNPPPNWTDHELYCGGRHQAEDPGMDCGVCGDPLSQATPRDNEIGGRYYAGIITGRYTSGQIIDVEVELTAAHLGYMEWRLCTNTATENQNCFNANLLQRADGAGSRLQVTNGPGWYRTQLRLPSGVRCSHCVIQWNYRAGNTWGTCPNGSQQGGCGPQETFRGCADVSIS